MLRTGRSGGARVEIWGKDNLGTDKYKCPVQISARKCLFARVAFNSGTEIWRWRQRWKSWGWGSGQRSCDEEAPVRSLSFILNTRRCHWRVLSFAGHHLGRQRIGKHPTEMVCLLSYRKTSSWYNLFLKGWEGVGWGVVWWSCDYILIEKTQTP